MLCGETKKTAAPLNQRMPAICGCAQAFRAGMCWNVLAALDFPCSFSRCYMERKTTKPQNTDGQASDITEGVQSLIRKAPL